MRPRTLAGDRHISRSGMADYAVLTGVVVVTLAIMRACQPGVEGMTPLACEVVPGSAQPSIPLANLAGRYTISVTAEFGPRAGRTAAGRLLLESFDASARAANVLAQSADPNSRYVLFGSATLPLDSIGATAPGPTDVDRPSQPGVLGIEWRSGGDAGWSTTLRFGSDANGSAAARFDGAYLSLTPSRVDPAGFSGRWESAGEGQPVGGYFCAVRS